MSPRASEFARLNGVGTTCERFSINTSMLLIPWNSTARQGKRCAESLGLAFQTIEVFVHCTTPLFSHLNHASNSNKQLRVFAPLFVFPPLPFSFRASEL